MNPQYGVKEQNLTIRDMESSDAVRVVGADGKSYRVPADSVLEAIGGGGGGSGVVDSVNGKTGVVVLDAGDIEFDDQETYEEGSVGEAIYETKQDLSQKPDIKDSDATGVDLDVSDEGGNVLVRFKDGEIQTKKFDSQNATQVLSGNGIADLDVADPEGNVVLRLKDGEIHTKYFHSKPKIITLKDSGGDFSTLKSALDSITDANPVTNPYEIHVYPGVYDTLAGFTEEEIQSADIGGGYTDQSMVGCKLTDGISIIGVGDRESIILTAELNPSDYSSAVRGNISTLNLKGNCRVENLTIKAKNIRYCVHDDFTFSEHYQRIVKNCRFVALGSLAYNPATTYGSGIREAGCDALFEDCDFGYDFGMHTREHMTGGSNVILRNCTGLKARLRDNSLETDVATHTFIFDGCDFNGINVVIQTATTPHIRVDGVNNLNTMIFGAPTFHPHLVNTLKTRASNIAIGTLVNVTPGGINATSGGIDAIVASSIDGALGVIVDRDSEYDYIQMEGFINGSRMGLTGLSVGDYITVDENMKLTGGGTSVDAVGVVRYTDSNNNSQIWLMRR